MFARQRTRQAGASANGKSSFEARRFTFAAGSRDYMLYIPALMDNAPPPLVVMLHGCKQSPGDFAIGTDMDRLANEHGVVSAYPRQSSRANTPKCWNWFNVGDQPCNQGEPSLISDITREVMGNHNIDPKRVYVAGLSASGAACPVQSGITAA